MSLAEELSMDTNSLEFLTFCRALHDAKKLPRAKIREFIESQPTGRREAVRAYFNRWDQERRK